LQLKATYWVQLMYKSRVDCSYLSLNEAMQTSWSFANLAKTLVGLFDGLSAIALDKCNTANSLVSNTF